LRNCVVVNSPPSFSTPLTGQGSTIPFYLPDQPSGAVITHTQLAATQGYVDKRIRYLLNFFFKTNAIMLWWGDWGTVPAGWSFCDGTLGSPDLRDRFVLCAGSHLAAKAAGGPAARAQGGVGGQRGGVQGAPRPASSAGVARGRSAARSAVPADRARRRPS